MNGDNRKRIQDLINRSERLSQRDSAMIDNELTGAERRIKTCTLGAAWIPELEDYRDDILDMQRRTKTNMELEDLVCL